MRKHPPLRTITNEPDSAARPDHSPGAELIRNRRRPDLHRRAVQKRTQSTARRKFLQAHRAPVPAALPARRAPLTRLGKPR